MSFRDFCRAFPFPNKKMSSRIILYESVEIRYMADGTRMKKGTFSAASPMCLPAVMYLGGKYSAPSMLYS